MRRVARDKSRGNPTDGATISNKRPPTQPSLIQTPGGLPQGQSRRPSEIQSLAQSLLQKQQVPPVLADAPSITKSDQDAPSIIKSTTPQRKPKPRTAALPAPRKRPSPDVENMLRFVQRALQRELSPKPVRVVGAGAAVTTHKGPWWCCISETGDKPYPLRFLSPGGDGYYPEGGGREVLVDTIRTSITRQLTHSFKRQCLIQIVGVLPDKYSYRDRRQDAQKKEFVVASKQGFVQLTQTSLVLVQRIPHPHAWKAGGKVAAPQKANNKNGLQSTTSSPAQQQNELTEQELIDRMMAQQEENDRRQHKEMKDDEDQNMPRPPPNHYICHYCQQKGHWQSDCLVLHTDMDRADWARKSQITQLSEQDGGLNVSASTAAQTRKSDPTSMLQVRQALRRLPHGIPRFLLQEVSVENIHEAQYRTADDKLLKYRVGVTLDASHSSTPSRISSVPHSLNGRGKNIHRTCDFCALVPFLSNPVALPPTLQPDLMHSKQQARDTRGRRQSGPGYRDAKRKRQDEPVKVAEPVVSWSITQCCNAPICSTCQSKFNFVYQAHLGPWTACAKCQHVYHHHKAES